MEIIGPGAAKTAFDLESIPAQLNKCCEHGSISREPIKVLRGMGRGSLKQKAEKLQQHCLSSINTSDVMGTVFYQRPGHKPEDFIFYAEYCLFKQRFCGKAARAAMRAIEKLRVVATQLYDGADMTPSVHKVLDRSTADAKHVLAASSMFGPSTTPTPAPTSHPSATPTASPTSHA